VEEELNGLQHYHGWIVLLVQLQNRSDVIELSRVLSQVPARFTGRWGEKEFVLIVDETQVDPACQRLQSADVPLKIARVYEDELEKEVVEAAAVIEAAQRMLA
jgi:hypothetical protein